MQSGDSIWSIAQRLNPTDAYDTRVIEDEIDSLNHLDGQAVLKPGQTLRIPMGGK